MITKKLICYLLVILLVVQIIWSQEQSVRPATLEATSENMQVLMNGNSEYEYAGRLLNPVNDAGAIGSTLQQLGFEVTTLTKANQRKIERSIKQFGRQLPDSKVIKLFY